MRVLSCIRYIHDKQSMGCCLFHSQLHSEKLATELTRLECRIQQESARRYPPPHAELNHQRLHHPLITSIRTPAFASSAWYTIAGNALCKLSLYCSLSILLGLVTSSSLAQ